MKKLLIIWLGCASILNFTKCGTKTNSKIENITAFDTIINYFSLRQKRELPKACTKLFVLTENGCVSCNKNFFNLIKENLKNDKSAFLFGTNGPSLDVSGLDSNENVYIDQSILETDYKIFHASKVIFFKEKRIDTIVTISANNIQKQFEFINNIK